MVNATNQVGREDSGVPIPFHWQQEPPGLVGLEDRKEGVRDLVFCTNMVRP